MTILRSGALLLALVFSTVVILSCLRPATFVTPPTRTPTPTPTAVSIPTSTPISWVRHAAQRLELGLPADWMVIQVVPEALDALIGRIGTTNPDLAPVMEALKHQDIIKLWAVDPNSPPGFAYNISVANEVRLIASLDQYAELLRKQVEPLGIAVSVEEKLNIDGREAFPLKNAGTVPSSSGAATRIEQQQLIVDDKADRYIITLTYLPKDSTKYQKLFDAIIASVKITQ